MSKTDQKIDLVEVWEKACKDTKYKKFIKMDFPWCQKAIEIKGVYLKLQPTGKEGSEGWLMYRDMSQKLNKKEFKACENLHSDNFDNYDGREEAAILREEFNL